MEAMDAVVTAIEKFGNMKPPKYDVMPSLLHHSLLLLNCVRIQSGLGLTAVLHFQLAAKQVKEVMDKKYAPNWCCIIGETFGADIVCEKQTLLYMFYAGNLAVLLFKNPF